LAKQPFKVADTVAAINRNFEYGKYIHESFWYWFPLNFNTTKMKDGRYHYHRFEIARYQPFSKNHFDGNIYLLQGPATFSAASVFTASLKGQDNVQLVGEETGGGYYGNTAIHLPMIVLPNTKIQVSLPLFRVVLDKDRPMGRGVMPDILVPPNSFAIRKGVDLKMEVVKEKIRMK
jgi:C-terminal processing protease CtpA/Prc